MNISSQPVTCFFSLNGVFQRAEVLDFDDAQLVTVCVRPDFCVLREECPPSLRLLRFPPIFLLKVDRVSISI